jgi:hypothetical protein
MKLFRAIQEVNIIIRIPAFTGMTLKSPHIGLSSLRKRK